MTAATRGGRLALISVMGLTALIFSPLVLQPVGTTFSSFYGYPYTVIRQMFRDGHWPLWDACSGAGTSLVADPLAGQFFPPFWVLGLVAPTALDGLRWVVFFHLLVTAVGGYLVARWVGSSPIAAVWAPMGLLLTPHLCSNILINGLPGEVYARAWMVVGLGCFWRGLIESNRRWLIGAGACLALQILGGTVYQVHFTVFLYGVIGLYWALTAGGRWWWMLLRGMGHVVLVLGVAAGLGAVKLLPVLEYQPLSTRTGYPLVEAEMGLANIPTLAQLWSINFG